MSQRALAISLALIAVLFVAVWGGGYAYLHRSQTPAKTTPQLNHVQAPTAAETVRAPYNASAKDLMNFPEKYVGDSCILGDVWIHGGLHRDKEHRVFGVGLSSSDGKYSSPVILGAGLHFVVSEEFGRQLDIAFPNNSKVRGRVRCSVQDPKSHGTGIHTFAKIEKVEVFNGNGDVHTVYEDGKETICYFGPGKNADNASGVNPSDRLSSPQTKSEPKPVEPSQAEMRKRHFTYFDRATESQKTRLLAITTRRLIDRIWELDKISQRSDSENTELTKCGTELDAAIAVLNIPKMEMPYGPSVGDMGTLPQPSIVSQVLGDDRALVKILREELGRVVTEVVCVSGVSMKDQIDGKPIETYSGLWQMVSPYRFNNVGGSTTTVPMLMPASDATLAINFKAWVRPRLESEAITARRQDEEAARIAAAKKEHDDTLREEQAAEKKKAEDAASAKKAADDEAKAETALKGAKNRHEAGQIEVAKNRLRKLIGDFPNTKTAKEARELLEKWSK